jgi:nitroreductase
MTENSSIIRDRRSIRSYSEDLVSESVLGEILVEARWAPSSTNTQSTFLYVISGARLDGLRAVLREKVVADAPPAPDIPGPATLPEPYLSRMNRLFQTRAAFVAAEEGGPPTAALAMAGLFGAPHLLVFAVDRRLPTAYACFDAGLFVQSVALAAQSRGLGTCVMTSPLRFAGLFHDALPGSEGQDLVAVMTLGHPDLEAAVNRFPRERLPAEEFATFLE